VVERRRSAIRTAVVWDALQSALATRAAARPDQPIQVVDLGGGTGGLAVRLAELGHQVVVVDPSPDALASLERRAAEVGVTDAVRGVLGDADTLLDLVGPDSADVVTCHGVLEVVDAPGQALQAVAAVLRPGGFLSLLATQRSGAVLARALAGHLADAQAIFLDPDGRWGEADPVPRRFDRHQLEELLGAAGLTVVDVHGVRTFADHVSSAVVDGEPGAAEELQRLEMAVSTHPDFMAVAAQLHVLAVPR
jgi:S-adenosylmethionine-dependent methyltransferase